VSQSEPARSLRDADEALASGEIQSATHLYLHALSVDPENVEALRGLEAARNESTQRIRIDGPEDAERLRERLTEQWLEEAELAYDSGKAPEAIWAASVVMRLPHAPQDDVQRARGILDEVSDDVMASR
jgi:hypothetical protein